MPEAIPDSFPTPLHPHGSQIWFFAYLLGAALLCWDVSGAVLTPKLALGNLPAPPPTSLPYSQAG